MISFDQIDVPVQNFSICRGGVGQELKRMALGWQGAGAPWNSDRSNNETVNVLAKLMKLCGSWQQAERDKRGAFDVIQLTEG